MSVAALVVLWSAILVFCWVSTLVAAFYLGRDSLERDAMYDAFQTVIRRAVQATALTDSMLGELGRQ